MFSRKFTLRHTFDEISELDETEGPDVTHFGVPWRIGVLKNPKSEKSGEPCLEVSLQCRKPGDKKNPWSVSVKATIRIENGNEEDNIEESFEGEYNDHEYYTDHVCDWDTLMKKYVKNDELTVEVEVMIREMKGFVLKRKISFDEPESYVSDVVLVVGDRKFHVSKVILGKFCDSFKPLLFAGDKKSKQEEIKLDEINPDTFQMVLEVIYGELGNIKGETVENILQLADQYKVTVATKRCSEFMINKPDVALDEKFRLASKFNLVELQDHLLHDIKSKTDSEDRLRESAPDMSDAFIMKMIRRMYK